MNPLWTSEAIAQATGGRATTSFEANGVAFDSREVTPGDLFVALHGETADGHDFIPRALAAGASGILADREVDAPSVRVDDTALALNALGSAARERTRARIIGVTGSVGKTGVKEALFAAFDRMSFGAAHRSLKSYNNHVGVPLSLARMRQETRYGVFEMGMNHEGELRALTAMVRPHVALITTIAPAHIEYFGTEEKIAEAKAEIFEGLVEGGTAIIPADSPHAQFLCDVAASYAANVVTFGYSEAANVRLIDEMPLGSGGTQITAQTLNGRLSFQVGMPGKHWVSNALAVLAAVEAAGGDIAQAGLALAEMAGLPGRGARRTMRTADGGEARIIDEAYNANPASMNATLAQLGQEKAARRIAILGAMKELGEQSSALHAGLAGAIRAAGVEFALLVGEEMAPLADKLSGEIAVEHVENSTQAIDIAMTKITNGDVVLVKGSNSIGLTRLVEQLAGSEGA